MKKSFLTSILIILVSGAATAQFNLDIEITGIRNNTGKIMLQVFDSQENIITQNIGDIREKSYTCTVKNLKPGNYAVRFFHDENMNQVMETSIVGKPQEGYGFSNNVTEKFSMPAFKKWLFMVDGNKKIVIRAVY